MDKIKVIVADEHTLALYQPGSGCFKILGQSLLKGYNGPEYGTVRKPTTHYSRYRLATPSDMWDFDVAPSNYMDNELYELVSIGDDWRKVPSLGTLFMESKSGIEDYQVWINALTERYESGGGDTQNVQEWYNYIIKNH